MYHGIRISGFGGQGVISAGILLAQAGMTEGKEVTFMGGKMKHYILILLFTVFIKGHLFAQQSQNSISVQGRLSSTGVVSGVQVEILANGVLVSTASPIDLAPDQNGVFTAYIAGFDSAVFQTPAGLFEISFKKNNVEIAKIPLTTVPFALAVRGINADDNILGASGNVGIGTMSTFTDQRGQTAKLNVAGPIKFNPGNHTVMMTDTPGYLEYSIDDNYWGVTIWASSKLFKTNITKLELDSEVIYDLRPVSFNWIAKRGGKRDFGLIAEEVEKVLPLLVNYDSEGKAFGVKYDLLSVLLLNELKQKNAEIGIIKGEMEQFKARLAKLEQSVR